MDTLSLVATARDQSRKAAAAGSGRTAETVYGGHEGELLAVPKERHSLEVIEDAAVLLAVVTLG